MTDLETSSDPFPGFRKCLMIQTIVLPYTPLCPTGRGVCGGLQSRFPVDRNLFYTWMKIFQEGQHTKIDQIVGRTVGRNPCVLVT